MNLLNKIRDLLKPKPATPPQVAESYTPEAVTQVDPTLPPLTKRPKQKVMFDRNITPIRDETNKTVIPIYTENPFGRRSSNTP